jgi:hypothetical protein
MNSTVNNVISDREEMFTRGNWSTCLGLDHIMTKQTDTILILSMSEKHVLRGVYWCADIKYLRKRKILDKDEVNKLIVDGNAISGITVDDLEVTLLRRLLGNLCPDLFMGDGCKTLQDFLKKNQHDIYHLFKFNQL